MDKVYKPKQFSKMLGVSVKTLQRWDNEGKLIAYRSPKNRRFYTHTQYEDVMGISQNQEGKHVIYARVSSRGQRDDLRNQVEVLRTYINSKGVVVDEVIEDIGSGLNYKRRKWNQLLDDVLEGKIKTIYITNQDRFVRFGFSWFQSFVEKFGATIVVVNHEEPSPQKEMVRDLISIIHVFSCRVHGLRKYKDRIKEDETL